MQSEFDAGEYFSKYSEDYYPNVHDPLQEAYQNIGQVLDKWFLVWC